MSAYSNKRLAKHNRIQLTSQHSSFLVASAYLASFAFLSTSSGKCLLQKKVVYIVTGQHPGTFTLIRHHHHRRGTRVKMRPLNQPTNTSAVINQVETAETSEQLPGLLRVESTVTLSKAKRYLITILILICNLTQVG